MGNTVFQRSPFATLCERSYWRNSDTHRELSHGQVFAAWLYIIWGQAGLYHRFTCPWPLGQGLRLLGDPGQARCHANVHIDDRTPGGHLGSLKTVWRKTLRRATVPYFRIYDLRSTYATRLSAGGVADEWVTQMLRQGDAQVFKKYSQMKLQMKREALGKLNRRANEEAPVTADALMTAPMCTVSLQ